MDPLETARTANQKQENPTLQRYIPVNLVTANFSTTVITIVRQHNKQLLLGLDTFVDKIKHCYVI